MRKLFLISALATGFFLSACNRQSTRDQSDSAAREAGRNAYKLDQDGKKAAHDLENGLNRAARDVHQGWDEAKHQDQTRH